MGRLREAKVEVVPGVDDNELTAEERKAFLEARIRKSVQWVVKPNEVRSFSGNNEDLLKKVAQRVHDEIVSDYQYNPSVLKATRAVKFTVGYVTKLIRSGLEDGTISLNEQAVQEMDNLTEGILSSEDVESRIQGIAALVARESLQR